MRGNTAAQCVERFVVSPARGASAAAEREAGTGAHQLDMAPGSIVEMNQEYNDMGYGTQPRTSSPQAYHLSTMSREVGQRFLFFAIDRFRSMLDGKMGSKHS